MKMLVNSCIRELDRKGVRVSRKFGAARPPKGGGGMQLASSEEHLLSGLKPTRGKYNYFSLFLGSGSL